MRIRNLLSAALFTLGGCATAAFPTPDYSYRDPTTGDVNPIVTSDVVQVQSYFRGVVDSFDVMIRHAELVKHGTELPIIAAGVFAPTWLALGKPTNGAIYAAGVGAAGGALSGYLGLRGRESAVVLARSAVTCVNREYVSQFTTARGLASLLDTARASSLVVATDTKVLSQSLVSSPTSAGDAGSAGDIAIGAVDEIISKLKIKLAGMGTIPDYSAIVKELQAKQKLADAHSGVVALSALSADQKTIAQSMTDYPVRIAACVAQFQ
jgi:hypothetical protein